MEFVHTGPVPCSDRRSKYRKLVQSAGRARHVDIEVLQARIKLKQSRLEACKQRSAEERAGECELCSVLQAQAFGHGLDSWYLRRCSSCWQQHAKLHTQQKACRSLLQKQDQRHDGSHTSVQDKQQSSQQHANTPATDANHSPDASSSSRLIQALDLADARLHGLAKSAAARAEQRTSSAAGSSRSSRPARLPVFVNDSSRTCCSTSNNHANDSFMPRNNSTLCSKQLAAEACQQQQVLQLCDGGQGIGGQRAKLQWEADAAHAVSQALGAAGIPATALISGARPRDAADIITVTTAAAARADCESSAAAGHACREEVQRLHSRRADCPRNSSGPSAAQHPSAWAEQQSSAADNTQLRHTTHAQPTHPAAAAPGSSSKVVSSRSTRPGSAPCTMQPLAAWQLKLAELEEACRNAEQLMLQAPTRAERSAALDLAVELREDIARIRQANRLQLKMLRSALLRQGVPPAALAAAAAVCMRSADECNGKCTAPRKHIVSVGAAAAERSHVLRVSGHPGMHLQQQRRRRQYNTMSTAAGNIPQPSPAASRCKSACEALKQLPIDDWRQRQRQRQEAAWQAPLRQELAALQAEAGEGRV